jgi:RNA polymerase sigma factor (sigma-70 family)
LAKIGDSSGSECFTSGRRRAPDQKGGIAVKEYSALSSNQHTADLNQAILHHEKLVRWVACRQWTGDLPRSDVWQVGRIGLWHALERYDPGRGTAFSTYAIPAITRAIWRAVVLAHRKPPEELTSHPPQAAPDLEDHLERVISYELLHRLVARLPHRWRAVIVTHYGLDGRPAQTLSELARAWEVKPQRIFQLRTEALLWLGHPARSLALRQWRGCNTVADYQVYLARQRHWRRMTRGRP